MDFTIDTSELSAEFNLTRADVDDLLEMTVKRVTATYARLWENQAKQKLKKSRSQYIRAIQIGERGRFTGVAYLNPQSWLANAVEVGHDPFDMKPGFMNSAKVKVTKKGIKYLTIPFRFATPDALGESEVFSGVMPAEILPAVHEQEKEAAKDGAPQGLQMDKIPSQYHMPKSAALRSRMKQLDGGFDKMKKGTEKTSMYEGLQRAAKGSGYVNFRRVSEMSDPLRFLHPGISAANLSGDAMDALDIPHEVDLAIDTFLSQKGF